MGIHWRSFIPRFFQRKASEVNRLIAAWFLGEPIWTPVNYENLAKEGFEKNIWVYRCIMAIAHAGASVPWLLFQTRRNGDRKEITQHALIDLLNNPNPFMSRQDLIEHLIAFQLLSGNAYLQHAGPKAGPPKELWALRPDRVRIIPHPVDLIGGYEYRIDDSLKQQFPADQITHFKFFSALDDFYGLSPIQVAARRIDSDNFANNWNASLLQNGARPSGALVTDSTLGDEQYKRLKQQIREHYMSPKNAGKPMLLEGGLDWKEMSLSPKDMDFIELKKMSRLEICAAFGVPPEIVGDMEHATYSNYQEARKAFYQDTVIPILYKIRDRLNSTLVKKFGDNLVLDVNLDAIDALQEDRAEMWDRVLNAVDKGLLSINEGRYELGFENIEGGDVRYVPMNVLLEGPDAPDYASLLAPDQPSNGQNNDEEPPDEAEDEGEAKNLELKSGLNLQTPIQKKQYWRSFDRKRIGFYNSVARQFKKQFEREKNGVLKAFDEGGVHEVERYLDENAGELGKALTATYIAVMDAFGKEVYSYLKGVKSSQGMEKKDDVEDEFDVFDKAVQEFISSTVANKIVNINDNTKNMVKEIISKGFEEQLTVPEIRDQIEALYLEQIIPNRSMVIARTEVISASNAGSRYAAKQTGLQLEKEWVATADKRTRKSHKKADGQRRGIDEPYEVGGHKLMYPGDPSGPAEEVIQCRCTEVYHTV
ncbi:phage portal protein [Anoxybacillus sp. FSL W8-1294]|uniref:phage portal protein n=1 Tax=Anoxybacillus sp. FSL W8-1294 TaxID=2954655 RepID=UPI0030D30105